MPRRGDPEKIYHAQRAGIFMRLVSYDGSPGLTPSNGAAWERHVAEAELVLDGGTFWDEAWTWIEAERRQK